MRKLPVCDMPQETKETNLRNLFIIWIKNNQIIIIVCEWWKIIYLQLLLKITLFLQLFLQFNNYFTVHGSKK